MITDVYMARAGQWLSVVMTAVGFSVAMTGVET